MNTSLVSAFYFNKYSWFEEGRELFQKRSLFLLSQRLLTNATFVPLHSSTLNLICWLNAESSKRGASLRISAFRGQRAALGTIHNTSGVRTYTELSTFRSGSHVGISITKRSLLEYKCNPISESYLFPYLAYSTQSLAVVSNFNSTYNLNTNLLKDVVCPSCPLGSQPYFRWDFFLKYFYYYDLKRRMDAMDAQCDIDCQKHFLKFLD